MADQDNVKPQRREAISWWHRFRDDVQNIGTAAITAVAELKPTKPKPKRRVRCKKVQCSTTPCRSGACRAVVTYILLVSGLALMITALCLTEWFILTPRRGMSGHVGLFRRCVYGPRAGESNCFYEIISETAAPLGLFFIGIVTAFGAIFIGVYRAIMIKCSNPDAIRKFRLFKRIRMLILASAISNVTAMLLFTYLYHNFLSPLGIAYVMGWGSCLLFLIASALSYGFSRQESQNTVSVTPQNMKTRKANVNRRASTDGRRTSTQVTTVTESIAGYKINPNPLHGKSKSTKPPAEAPKP